MANIKTLDFVGALETLVGREEVPPTDDRFDPTLITHLLPGEGEEPVSLYFKGSVALPIGGYCVAVYEKVPEATSRSNTENIIHACDYGVLRRRPTGAEIPLADRIGEQRGLGAAHAWAFELLSRLPDEGDTLVATGKGEPYIPIK